VWLAYTGVVIGYFALQGVTMWLISKYLKPSALRTLLFYIVSGVLAAIVTQTMFYLAFEQRIARNEKVRAAFDYAFSGKSFKPNSTDLYYVAHHAMNYALNPARLTPDGKKGVNATYRIRRLEPIRTRAKVRTRVLVLGGSTTMEGQFDNEQDTWVWRVENTLRSKLGNELDVINGGVAGYTLQENFIHYITLLRHLDPDVVVLFVGLNDVHPRLYDQIAFDYSNYRIPFRELEFPASAEAFRWFYGYRLYYLSRFVEPAVTLGLHRLSASKGEPHFNTWPAALKRNGTQAYAAKMEDLLLLLRGQGKKVLVVPQYIYAPKGTMLHAFRDGVLEHNQINTILAEKMGMPVCKDITRDDAFVPGDTGDGLHFTASGAAKMAAIVFRCLDESGLVKTSTKTE
jgi:lysophospholipase L1-like esterase